MGRNGDWPYCSLLFLWVVSTAALADVIPGRWEKVASVEAGTVVSVKLGSGETLEGIFQELTPQAVVIHVGTNILSVERHHVVEIRRLDLRPSRHRGWLLPAAGFGVGFLIGFGSGDDGVFYDFTAEANGLFPGGIGAGTGWLIDRILDHRDRSRALLY